MSITTTIVGLPAASAVNVDHKRYVTSALLPRGEKVTSSNGVDSRSREWVINPGAEFEAKVTMSYRFDSKANKGAGRTDVRIQIDTWVTRVDGDGLVLTVEPIGCETHLFWVGKKATAEADQMLELVLGAHGLCYTLDTEAPEEEQILWVASGTLAFYAE